MVMISYECIKIQGNKVIFFDARNGREKLCLIFLQVRKSYYDVYCNWGYPGDDKMDLKRI